MFGVASLFLSASRRTGKSNFLLKDLKPALAEAGASVLYVDLWADKARDPGELIAITVANALAEAQGAITRAAKAAGLSKVNIKGIEFTLNQVGNAGGASLSDALQALQDKIKAPAPIVLVVDEAQYAITTRSGMNAMFALKAARDALNAHAAHRFCIVMSGSDRDKLLRLVHGNNAPFLGSHIDPMPLLGSDFTDHIAGQLAQDIPALTIDNARLAATFVRFDHRKRPPGSSSLGPVRLLGCAPVFTGAQRWAGGGRWAVSDRRCGFGGWSADR